jgi:succinate dehydrogenase/fumarate reductase flavoprotein subunit
MVEFMQYEPHLIGRGVEIDIDGQSNIPGLFAAGDPVGNFRADIAGAAVYGHIAGEAAAKYIKEAGGFVKAEACEMAEERIELYAKFMSRNNGPNWKEANLALQQIMRDYAGIKVRSQTMLSAGLKYMGDLKMQVLETMQADNSHNLMRCMEVLDLFECAESIFLSALERKETRGHHKRSDFPFTNPLLADKFLTVRKDQGEGKLEWRNRM